MISTLNIGDKEVQLNNNIGWTIAYRDQFGKDIIPSLLPMAESAMDIVAGVINETGGIEEVSTADILRILDGDFLIDAMIHLGNFEFVDFLNITWALAKCADDSLPDPKTWVKQFDEFPLDLIVPEVFRLIIKGIVSSKNLERLNVLKQKVQPIISNSTR